MRMDLPMNDREEARVEEEALFKRPAAAHQAARLRPPRREEEEGVTHGV